MACSLAFARRSACQIQKYLLLFSFFSFLLFSSVLCRSFGQVLGKFRLFWEKWKFLAFWKNGNSRVFRKNGNLLGLGKMEIPGLQEKWKFLGSKEMLFLGSLMEEVQQVVPGFLPMEGLGKSSWHVVWQLSMRIVSRRHWGMRGACRTNQAIGLVSWEGMSPQHAKGNRAKRALAYSHTFPCGWSQATLCQTDDGQGRGRAGPGQAKEDKRKTTRRQSMLGWPWGQPSSQDNKINAKDVQVSLGSTKACLDMLAKQTSNAMFRLTCPAQREANMCHCPSACNARHWPANVAASGTMPIVLALRVRAHGPASWTRGRLVRVVQQARPCMRVPQKFLGRNLFFNTCFLFLFNNNRAQYQYLVLGQKECTGPYGHA